MCNACGFYCCGSDRFSRCGCDHCDEPDCRDDRDSYDEEDDYPFDEETAALCAAHQQEEPTQPPSNRSED